MAASARKDRFGEVCAAHRRHAATRPDRDWPGAGLDGLAQLVNKAIAEGRRVGLFRHREQYGELVAADPRTEILDAAVGGNPITYSPQHLVADGVAVGVVDRLEPVQVQVEHQADGATQAGRHRDVVLQCGKESGAVGQAGQGVDRRGSCLLLHGRRALQRLGDELRQLLQQADIVVGKGAGAIRNDLQHPFDAVLVNQWNNHHRTGADPTASRPVDSGVGLGVLGDQNLPQPHRFTGQTAHPRQPHSFGADK